MRCRILVFLSLFTILLVCEAAYRPNGRCGSDYDGALCDPAKGGICCSINGFCGETDDYCLTASGCQLNCTDGTPTAKPPSATNTPTPSGGLTSAKRTGIIAGSVVGVVVLIIICVMVWLWWRHKERKLRIKKEGTALGPALHDSLVVAGLNPEQRAYVMGLLDGAGAASTQAAGARRAILPPDTGRHNDSRVTEIEDEI